MGAMHGNIGGILFLIGWVWLIVMGFKDKDWWWGLVVLFIPILGGLGFGFIKWPGTKTPLILYIIGIVLGGSVKCGWF